MLAITLFTGILAGTYPALILSGFKPIKTLKGAFSAGSKGGTFRRVTVIVQFALSIMLITGTLVLYRQLHHLQGQKLGYDKENLLYLPLRGELKKAYPMIKEELLKEPVVKFITAAPILPRRSVATLIMPPGRQVAGHGYPYQQSGVDFDYVETMGIEMKSGRTFSKSFSGFTT
jgi:hypothetical protein